MGEGSLLFKDRPGVCPGMCFLRTPAWKICIVSYVGIWRCPLLQKFLQPVFVFFTSYLKTFSRQRGFRCMVSGAWNSSMSSCPRLVALVLYNEIRPPSLIFQRVITPHKSMLFEFPVCEPARNIVGRFITCGGDLSSVSCERFY
jgi:hypothetical protein